MGATEAAGFSPSPTALGVEAGVEERREGEMEQREEVLVLEAIFTQVTECLFDVTITMCASI